MNPLVLSDDDGIRPAGRDDTCFYCNQTVGQPHKDDCVILKRKVKVRYTFEIEVEVPHSWNEHDIEFHRNESSWCADNAICDIQRHAEENGCLCSSFEAEVIEPPEAPPYRKNKDGEIMP